MHIQTSLFKDHKNTCGMLWIMDPHKMEILMVDKVDDCHDRF
jgi:hypothetical protein